MVTIPTSEHYNMLKPRDIREQLRGKIDPQVGAVLIRLCEDGRETRNQVVAMGRLLDGMLNQMNVFIQISAAMKAQYEAKFGPLVPPNQQGPSASDAIKQIGGGQADGG